MYAQFVIRLYLQLFDVGHTLNALPQGMQILFGIGVTGYQHVTNPGRFAPLRQVIGKGQGACIGASGQLAVAFFMGLLNVEQNQIGVVQQFLNVVVKQTSVGIDAGMKAGILEGFEKFDKAFGLNQRLSAGNGNSALLAKKGLLTTGHGHQVLGGIGIPALKGDGVGIGAVEEI